MATCESCHGSAKCRVCDGADTADEALCSACHGTGRCQTCSPGSTSC